MQEGRATPKPPITACRLVAAARCSTQHSGLEGLRGEAQESSAAGGHPPALINPARAWFARNQPGINPVAPTRPNFAVVPEQPHLFPGEPQGVGVKLKAAGGQVIPANIVSAFSQEACRKARVTERQEFKRPRGPGPISQFQKKPAPCNGNGTFMPGPPKQKKDPAAPPTPRGFSHQPAGHFKPKKPNFFVLQTRFQSGSRLCTV